MSIWVISWFFIQWKRSASRWDSRTFIWRKTFWISEVTTQSLNLLRIKMFHRRFCNGGLFSKHSHCIKRVRIRIYSGPHFSQIFPYLDWIRGKCGPEKLRIWTAFTLSPNNGDSRLDLADTSYTTLNLVVSAPSLKTGFCGR